MWYAGFTFTKFHSILKVFNLGMLRQKLQLVKYYIERDYLFGVIISDKSYKHFTLVNYDSRVVLTRKKPKLRL